MRSALRLHALIQVPNEIELHQYVFDNSVQQELHSDLQSLCTEYKATLVILPENGGVSGAYAKACELVIQDNFDYLWLWDQDSSPKPDCLTTLLSSFTQAQKQSSLPLLGAVSPRLIDPSGKDNHYVFYSEPFDLLGMRTKRFPTHLILSGEVTSTFFVNSGTLLAKAVIAKVGAPDVDFFMDLVDFDYSSRIVSAGFRLILNANTSVDHQVGNPDTRVIMGLQLINRKYSNFRYYYQARNEILMAQKSKTPIRFTFRALVHLTLIAVRIVVTESCVFSKILAFKIGIIDGLLGKKGKSYPKWIDSISPAKKLSSFNHG